MRISILIPCHNEEKSIAACVRSCLMQTRKADEIIIVNDGSTDGTADVLAQFKDAIRVITIPVATGNKSHAQEYGLKFVTGDIFIATDGDTLLKSDFIERIEKDFADPDIGAVSGAVKSVKYNWITACRALDYTVGHSIDKLAQDYINYMFVIAGAAGAFRTSIFNTLGFDHDTLTEDLDFTYKLHRMGVRIKYDPDAICYTQDPADLKSYINQTRRWFAGGWQNLMKHMSLPEKPGMAFELSLLYCEGLIFSVLLFVMPFINLFAAVVFLLLYLVIVGVLSFFGASKENRWDFLLILPHFVFLKYVNSWIYLEQFFKEVILKRKNLIWFKPERVLV